MAIAESVLKLTDEDGNVTRLPVLKSTMIKFERRFKRPYATDSVADAATMSYFLAHDQHWPATDDVLMDWFDSVRFEAEDAEEAEANGQGPTAPPALS